MTEPHEPSDAELVRDIRAGSVAAFEPLMQRHEALVFRFLLGKTGNRSDAEDLLQQTFILAYRKLHRYKTRYPFTAWILAIARNLAASRYRREKSREARREGMLEAEESMPTPAENLLAAETASEIWRIARLHLSEESCDALFLAYQEDWSMDQIAQSLRCSTGRVKVMLHRARKKLAPILSRHVSACTSSSESHSDSLLQGAPS